MKNRKNIFKILSYGLFIFFSFSFFVSISHADELIESAFMGAKTHETIVDLGDTKDAVGNEIFRESIGTEDSLGQGCFLNGGDGQKIDGNEVKKQICEIRYEGIYNGKIGANNDECILLPSGQIKNITNEEKEEFCKTVLGGDWDIAVLTTKPPLIVRITKFLLRLVIVLSITMVIYTGIMYIIEASKGAEVTNARDNLMYIIGGVLLALMSLGLINLITSLTVSSLAV